MAFLLFSLERQGVSRVERCNVAAEPRDPCQIVEGFERFLCISSARLPLFGEQPSTTWFSC